MEKECKLAKMIGDETIYKNFMSIFKVLRRQGKHKEALHLKTFIYLCVSVDRVKEPYWNTLPLYINLITNYGDYSSTLYFLKDNEFKFEDEKWSSFGKSIKGNLGKLI